MDQRYHYPCCNRRGGLFRLLPVCLQLVAQNLPVIYSIARGFLHTGMVCHRRLVKTKRLFYALGPKTL